MTIMTTATIKKSSMSGLLLKPGISILLITILFFLSCKKEYSCENCIGVNQPPIAKAGPDQVIALPTDSVSLDGSASSDPDGIISVWLWTKISGPASFAITNSSTAKTSIKNLSPGVYRFELKVTDNGSLSARDTISVIVDSVLTTNHPPVANAGADQIITLPVNNLNLDGSGSADPENNIIVYAWTKIAGPPAFNIANANAVQTQVTNLIQGTYQFELKVIDAGGLFSKDTVQITVDSVSSNHPPIADAGPDQLIILPTNTVSIDGSNSTDPDNNITSYAWTKISGPSSFNISNASTVQTPVTTLVQGIYRFELKVTDAGSLFSKDTMQVTVNAQPPSPCDNSNRPHINAQLVPIGTLSQTRIGMAAVSAGTKILFAGSSQTPGGGYGSTRVDIYDIISQSWSTAELSVARFSMGTVAAGNKIFFAGGENGDGAFNDVYSTVDIYDVSSNTWSVASLSEPRSYVAASVVGNKVFFAGGEINDFQTSNKVDVYDLISNTWTTSQLSEARASISAVTVNNKIYFAGGWTTNYWDYIPSNRVDIYDNTTHSWTTSSLSEVSGNLAGINMADKIYWASECKMETKDVNTWNSSVSYLFMPGVWRIDDGQNAVTKNGKIIFYRHIGSDNKFDIYDVATDQWTIGVLSQNYLWLSSIISVNNIIYIAGGGDTNGVLSNQVWKLEF